MERYKIFSISEGWLQDYREFGFQNDQIFYVPQATAIRKTDIEQTMNVSFLGIRHFHNAKYFSLVKSHKFGNRFYSLVKEFLDTGNYDYEALFKKHFQKDYPELIMELRALYPLFDYRWLTLANMLDLGLTISGHDSRWEDAAEYMPQLVAAYNPQQVWTLEQNNWFYNASKVSLCPVTAQARGSAFSWRVFDIMASNACLLISEASDLKTLTKDYVDIPMYRTPWEARDLCKKLLEDDSYRRQIVSACQKYVDENARWINRFTDMQNIMGIKVIGESGRSGTSHDAILDDPEALELVLNKNKTYSVIAGVDVPKNPYDILRPKIKSFLYKWTPSAKIVYIAELGALLILLGCCLAFLQDLRFLTSLGELLCWIGLGTITFSAGLFVANILLKIRRARWNK